MKKILSLSVFITVISIIHAQPAAPDSLVTKIELKDGSSLIGTMMSEDSLGIDFRTLGGVTARIAHTQIRFKFPYQAGFLSIDTVKKRTIIDPNRTRLFLMPTARPIGSGNGYFSAYEIFFPTLAFGVGNILSVAGGMSIFPGSKNQLFYFAPKVTLLNTTNTSVAVGGVYLGAGGNDEGSSLVYGAATFGNEKGSLTIAARIPTEQDQNSLFVIGGELQTSNTVKLITENWIFSNSILYSFGVRFFGDKLAADLGFMRLGNTNSGAGFPFFPWLGFTYNFGTPTPASHEIDKSEIFASSTYRARFSFGLFTSTGNDEMKEQLRDQGFQSNNYNSGLFSSDDENNTDGSGVMIQVERSFHEQIAFGITVSTIGKLIGAPSSFQAYKNYSTPYYVSTTIDVDHSILTYGVHVSYSSLKPDNNDRSYSFGAGVGNSDITTEWRFSDYYNFNSTPRRTISLSQFTGLVFFTLQQHVTQYISIGIDGAYFFMADSKINNFDLGSMTYKDYSTTPAVDRIQPVSISSIHPNFSYGKAGIALEIHF